MDTKRGSRRGRNELFVPVTTTTIDVCRRYGGGMEREGSTVGAT